MDAGGRVWTPREQREVVLDEFERSGLPAAKFAQHIGMKASTVASWIRRRREDRSEADAVNPSGRAALQWVEASVEATSGGASRALVVHLPGGARVEVADAAQAVLAAELLRALVAGGGRC
ncbi:MAG: IS66 family insertion sequence element accessory protein TnpB [Chthoniobacteraceae bacterium]